MSRPYASPYYPQLNVMCNLNETGYSSIYRQSAHCYDYAAEPEKYPKAETCL